MVGGCRLACGGDCAGVRLGVISDTDPQPLVVASHLGTYALVTVGILTNINDLMWSELFMLNREPLLKYMDIFLDEFAEFPRPALEVLRQPLEDGHVCVSRAAAAYDFPSEFMLVAAMNPCPCGWYGDQAHACRCSPTAILKYQSRVSGPLLDRIDIQVEVPSVDARRLPMMEHGEPSAAIRERVMRARALQAERYRDMPGVRTNAQVRSRHLADVCRFTAKDRERLVRTIERLNLSARAYDKVLRVARTLADLAGSEGVRDEDLLAAIGYRRCDDESNSFWM